MKSFQLPWRWLSFLSSALADPGAQTLALRLFRPLLRTPARRRWRYDEEQGGRATPMFVVTPQAAGMETPSRSGAIELSGVAKQFGGTTVLRGIDLDVRAGEFITILGP